MCSSLVPCPVFIRITIVWLQPCRATPNTTEHCRETQFFTVVNSCPLKIHCIYIPICISPEVMTLMQYMWDYVGPTELNDCDTNEPWTRH